MGTLKKHILIVAGEASGDQHAAHLVSALKAKDPSLTFSGLGGPQMKEAGVTLYHDLTRIAVVGFWEVLKNYGEFKRLFNEMIEMVEATNADAIILVDYPGFNLRLAKALKEKNIKVIYYISPQVWAWKEKRVREIKKHVDQMLVLFEFEKDFYAKHGMDVDFVGHPLLDQLQNIQAGKMPSPLSTGDFTVALMPGSREKEVDRHLPVMIKSLEQMKHTFPKIQFLVIQSPTLSSSFYETLLTQTDIPHSLIKEDRYTAIASSHACLVASGTATLEVALLGKPMVVIYKTSWITWALAKLFVKIDFIGMVNVVAGKQIIPECIQHQAHPVKIAEELTSLVGNEIRLAKVKEELSLVRKTLGEPGASQRAALKIIVLLAGDPFPSI